MTWRTGNACWLSWRWTHRWVIRGFSLKLLDKEVKWSRGLSWFGMTGWRVVLRNSESKNCFHTAKGFWWVICQIQNEPFQEVLITFDVTKAQRIRWTELVWSDGHTSLRLDQHHTNASEEEYFIVVGQSEYPGYDGWSSEEHECQTLI